MIDNDNLHHLDIRVYSTVSGRQLIGEFVDIYDDVIQLNCPLEMVRIHLKEGIAIRLVHAIPHNDGAPMCIYIHAVESESFASDAMKESYYKQLALDRISLLLTESIENKIKDDEQTLTSLDPLDSFKYDWNGSVDRWSN